MPAQPIARRRRKMLDEMGEEAVFEGYLQIGGVRELVADLWEPNGEGATNVSPRAFYQWLREEPGRWERWQKVKKIRGDMEFERVQQIAGEIDGDNYREKKVEADVRQWIAERLNKDYSHRQQHDVQVTITHSWLDALEQIEEGEEIPEAEATVLEEDDTA